MEGWLQNHGLATLRKAEKFPLRPILQVDNAYSVSAVSFWGSMSPLLGVHYPAYCTVIVVFPILSV